ncbi:MAG: peptidoglycan editing factor PgeF [Bacteroidota bacterium]|nr:peptidoglycan editing factor PgeF [Bacteroidota bacterium]
MITYNLLEKYKEIAHFCTDREGGASAGNYASFNLSPFSGDQPEDFNRNKSILSKQLGINTDKLIIPFQTHGSEILEIDDSFLQLSNNERSRALNGIDALFTRLKSICIGVTTADCVPLLFYDPDKEVIAVAHAGWRGTCARIAEKTIRTLIKECNCEPSSIRVAIGPSISANAYEVGKDVVDCFEEAGFDLSKVVTTNNQSCYLDLWKANQLPLEKAGVLSEHIEVSGICTFTEHERYFSARRLGIKSGRMLSGIMIKGK